MYEALKIKSIEKYYGKKEKTTKAIDNISFSVNKGEFLGIMGASGSGKTTLLNCISTIDSVTNGDIFIKSENITKLKREELSKFRREELGFVFQDYNLLDTLSAYENIALALTISKVKYNVIKEKIKEISKTLGIENILSKYPYELSGGERQRVSVARAIITNPTLILADEPTGALDSSSSKSLLETFTNINKEMGATIIMVTHDAFVASYCNRILFLRDGKIFNEINKYNKKKSRKEFFNEIIEVVSPIGEDIFNCNIK